MRWLGWSEDGGDGVGWGGWIREQPRPCSPHLTCSSLLGSGPPVVSSRLITGSLHQAVTPANEVIEAICSGRGGAENRQESVPGSLEKTVSAPQKPSLPREHLTPAGSDLVERDSFRKQRACLPRAPAPRRPCWCGGVLFNFRANPSTPGPKGTEEDQDLQVPVTPEGAPGDADSAPAPHPCPLCCPTPAPIQAGNGTSILESVGFSV